MDLKHHHNMVINPPESSRAHRVTSKVDGGMLIAIGKIALDGHGIIRFR